MPAKKTAKFAIVFFLAIGFACGFFFENQAYAKRDMSFVVANVNNKIISHADLQDRYHFVISTSEIRINSAAEKSMLLSQIIDKMIDEELVRQEAAKLGISVSPEEIDNAVASIAKRQNNSVAGLRRSFKEKNLSFQALQNQIAADILWSKIISESLKSKIKITDLEIKEFFEQHKIDMDVLKYKIAEIYIPNSADAKALATKLVAELRNGADFENIVKQFSRSATAENAGEVGWASKNDISEKIYSQISKISKAEYTDPIFLADGYYIFKLLDKKIMTQIQEDDITMARNRIFMQELEVEAKRYLMDMHKNSFIEIDRKALIL